MEHLNAIDDMVIEPLSDDLLDAVAGATSAGSTCCSCQNCSNSTGGTTGPTLPTAEKQV